VTTSTTETSSLELGHYFQVLRRRAWLIALFTVLGLLAALAYLAGQSREVTATTTVDVSVISSDPFGTPRSAADLLDPETEMQTASSSAVLQAAAEQIGDVTPAELRSDMTATLVNDATIMRIAYTAGNRSDAETGADAIANAYTNYRAQRADGQVTRIVNQLNQRRDTLREDLLRLNTIIRDSNAGSNRAIQAETDRQLVNIELDRLSAQINTFLGLDTTGGTILTAAEQNPTQVAPGRGLVISSGIAAGLILGIIAAFVYNAVDRRIRDAFDVRRARGGQVLGELEGKQGSLPATDEELETVRSVRELLYATLAAERPVVAVADLTPSAAGADVAVNLAYTVAETGRRVDLVMADFDPTVVESVAQALQLSLVGSGTGVRRMTRGPLTLVAPSRGNIVALDDAAAGQEGVMTVVAIPRGAAHSSLLAAGRLGHAVVLVVAKGGTPKRALVQAAEELAVVGAKVHGTVLVSSKRRPAPELSH
jgi:capsular polysaccharide biosynthesis protein